MCRRGSGIVILLSVAGGVLAGYFFRRFFSPAFFPFMMIFPFLPFFSHWSFLVGFTGSLLVLSDESRARFSSSRFSLGVSSFSSVISREVLVGFVVAIVGLSVFSLGVSFSFLEPLIPFVLLFILGILFSHRAYSRLPLVIAIVACLVIGWLLLQRWTIPLALPAWLSGFFFSNTELTPRSASSFFQCVRDALLGVLAGVLPGLGPGLIGIAWFSHSFSFALVVSNLVFSVGFVSLSGRLRSIPAAVLGEGSLPSWEWLVVWLFVAAWVSAFVFSFHSFSLFPPGLFLGALLTIFFLGILGNVSTLLVLAAGFLVSRLLAAFRLPRELGLLVLIPSLFFFYL